MIWASFKSIFSHKETHCHFWKEMLVFVHLHMSIAFLGNIHCVCTCVYIAFLVKYDMGIIRKQFLSTFTWQWWHHVPLPHMTFYMYLMCNVFFTLTTVLPCLVSWGFSHSCFKKYIPIIPCLFMFGSMIQVWPWTLKINQWISWWNQHQTQSCNHI